MVFDEDDDDRLWRAKKHSNSDLQLSFFPSELSAEGAKRGVRCVQLPDWSPPDDPSGPSDDHDDHDDCTTTVGEKTKPVSGPGQVWQKDGERG